MTCNFETIWPAFIVFDAKQIRVEGFSFPATCKRRMIDGKIPKKNKANYHKPTGKSSKEVSS